MHDQLIVCFASCEQSEIREFKLDRGRLPRLEVRRKSAALGALCPCPGPAALYSSAQASPAARTPLGPTGLPCPRADLVEITAPDGGTFYRAAAG